MTPTSLSSPSGRPRRGPEYQTRRRTERLAEVDRKRSGYLDLAAEGIIGRDELRAKLAALDETRAAAESELAAVRARAERLEEFEREAEAVLEVYAQLTPEALDALAPEERQQFYRVLGLRVTAHQDAPPEIDGTFVADDAPLGAVVPFRSLDTTSGRYSGFTKFSGITFSAVLPDGASNSSMFQHGRIGAERNTVYRMLRLKVKPAPAGYEITGTFMYEGTDKLASAQKYTNRELTFRALLAQDRTQLLELTRG